MFYKKKNNIKVSKISKYLRLRYKGKDFNIEGVTSLNKLKNNHITFFTEEVNRKFKLKEKNKFNFKKLKKYSNILVITDKINSKKIPCSKIISKNPRFDFQKISNKFFVIKKQNYIHSTSIIENPKNLGKNVNVGSNTFIEKNVKVGKNTIILSNVVITGEVIIGSNCVIKSNTTIGSEGFGFAYNNNKHIHFPHTGGIKIGKRVWIGSNVSIEKGSLDNTIISDGVLIDDLVQIGHNVKIGKGCQITAGSILSGRCKIRRDCWIAPNVSVDNNITIGYKSIVGMGSVVRKDVKSKSVIAGNPAKLLRILK